MNIVQLKTNEDVSEEDQDEFFSTLKEQTDQLIYVSRDIDGKFSFGHTPLDSRDLALMSWHLHRVIDMLIQHAGSNDED
jgi:hypothetical protein